jgi:hypothetical protein
MINQALNLHEPGLTSARFKGIGHAVLMLAVCYICWTYGEVGWLTYLLAVPPLGVLLITVIARVNDLPIHQQSAFWDVRRMALVLLGIFTVAMLGAPLSGQYPSWRMVFGIWGMAGVMVTSPHLPPWWKYVAHGSTNIPVFKTPLRRASDDFDSNPQNEE